jgi:hypothetical protein
LGHTVGAGFDNVGNFLAESVSDIIKPRQATVILDRIVQESGDRHILRTAVLEHCCSHCEQVGDIRDCCTLADLTAMHMNGIEQGAVEAIG